MPRCSTSLSSQAVGVSAMTGEGMEELFDAVREAREEYETDYKPELEKIIAERVRFPALPCPSCLPRQLLIRTAPSS